MQFVLPEWVNLALRIHVVIGILLAPLRSGSVRLGHGLWADVRPSLSIVFSFLRLPWTSPGAESLVVVVLHILVIWHLLLVSTHAELFNPDSAELLGSGCRDCW